MNNDIAIKVSGLTKVYKLYNSPMDRLKEALSLSGRKYHKDFHALNDVSFEIKKGETVGIIGKNGSGKSTLLKIITGVLTPTIGTVEVNGKISALLELGAGFNPEYTGLENIYFQGSIMGYSHEEMKLKVHDIVSFADIGDFIHQPVKMYSSGMFARLAFAVAINVEPDILIVDEALSVGDMAFQAKCMTAMDRIRQNGATVLFVSHDINGVKSLCQKCIYIEHGSMIQYGIASDVADQYIKNMRTEITSNDTAEICNHNKPIVSVELNKTKEPVEFITSTEFDKSVSTFRYGSGGVRITYVDVLDINGESVVVAEFNQRVKIKIYCISDSDREITVNFQVNDDKKLNITGADFFSTDYGLLSVQKGQKFIVEYELNLALCAGNYSIAALITTPVVFNHSADFIDVVADSYVIKVLERDRAKVWSKVFLFPNISVTHVV